MFPRIIKPDAGFSNPTDVIHRHKINAIQMCPECGNTNLKKGATIKVAKEITIEKIGGAK